MSDPSLVRPEFKRSKSQVRVAERLSVVFDDLEEGARAVRVAALQLAERKRELESQLQRHLGGAEIDMCERVDRIDLRARGEHVTALLSSVVVEVGTARSASQREAFELADRVISAVEGELDEVADTLGEGSPTKKYVKDVREGIFLKVQLMHNSVDPEVTGPVDERFQAQVLSCGLEDQREFRKRLTSAAARASELTTRALQQLAEAPTSGLATERAAPPAAPAAGYTQAAEHTRTPTTAHPPSVASAAAARAEASAAAYGGGGTTTGVGRSTSHRHVGRLAGGHPRGHAADASGVRGAPVSGHERDSAHRSSSHEQWRHSEPPYATSTSRPAVRRTNDRRAARTSSSGIARDHAGIPPSPVTPVSYSDYDPYSSRRPRREPAVGTASRRERDGRHDVYGASHGWDGSDTRARDAHPYLGEERHGWGSGSQRYGQPPIESYYGGYRTRRR